MYSLTLTRCMHVKQRDVVPGQVVQVEGAALVSVLDAGVEKVQLSGGILNEKFVGFSTAHNFLPSLEAKVITAIVPAAPAYTVQLRFGNLEPGQIRIVGSVTGPLVENIAVGPGQYSAVDASGLLTFNAAQAGETVTIYVKHQLTMQEAMAMREAAGTGGVTSVNNYAPAYFSKIGVGHGEGELFTDQYDVTADFSTGVVKTGAGGLFTIGGNGDASNFVVIQVPSVASPLLGLRFNV
jgi:hypothetical protein